ncbi:MAG: membrane protein insertase YidC, partial [Pseudomonadota bacterium]
MIDNRNTILAVILSGLVLIAWQYFYNIPTMEKQRAAQQAELAQKQAANPATPATTTPGANQPAGTTPAAPGQQSGAPATPASAVPVQPRPTVIAASPRVKIETPSISGSIALTGARIDDVALLKFRETVDPKSPAIELFSPSGTKEPFYAEFGFVPSAGSTIKMPTKDTVWTQEGTGALTPAKPITLTWNNGQGLTFKRTISIDDKYLFTIKDDVSNVGDAPVTLYPFGLISRHGTPPVSGYYILHEGLIGVLGDQGLQEFGYKKMDETKAVEFKVTNAWMGITDKYWASTLLPSPKANVQARFSSNLVGTLRTYQTDYLLDPLTVAIGGTATTTTNLFAGAKENAVVDAYDKQLGLNKFDRLIDWGWFYFITKPMFFMIDWFFHIFGNFGVAILAVTVLVKLVFFPLASKSYASMAKMKAVQPQLAALKDKYPDDKVKQQQEMMEIYKKEKINPIAGCLPILIQIPVFFSLYKVLFVTIEMRHAPFFGWIKDLSAPDPTNMFNLFGLLAFDPTQLPVLGYYLHLGIWPILMGITMWFQMKLNPTPPDP